MVKAEEVKAWVEEELGTLQVVNGGELDGEARLFRLPGSRGDVGFISSVTAPFCAACTRARLTARLLSRLQVPLGSFHDFRVDT